MEIADLISFAEKYLVEYAAIFMKSLAHPVKTFQPLNTTSVNETDAAGDFQSRPSLLAFVLISIFVGSILNSFVPARKYSGNIIDKVIVVLLLWLCFAVCTHVLCRTLHGKAEFKETLWVSLQIFSVLFVVSSFVNLVGGVLVRQPQVSAFPVFTGKFGNSIANNPFYIYFLVQFTSLNVYLPLAIKRIHGFGWIRPVLVGAVLSLFWVGFGILFSSEIGIHYRKY